MASPFWDMSNHEDKYLKCGLCSCLDSLGADEVILVRAH